MKVVSINRIFINCRNSRLYHGDDLCVIDIDIKVPFKQREFNFAKCPAVQRKIYLLRCIFQLCGPGGENSDSAHNLTPE